MLAIIILVLVTLLVGNTFLSKKKTSKKKKIVTIIISCVLIILVIYPLLYDGIKNTYCLSDDKCVTVWKRGNGEAYIIFGKHKGQKIPTDNYIQTTNTKYLTIYFSSDIPNSVIVRDQGSSTGIKEKYHIVNNSSKSLRIVEYSEEYKKILYKPNAIKFNDVKESAEYLDIDIKENYATDKTGEKIE